MENMTLIHEIQLYYRIDLIVFMTDMPVFHKNKNVVFGFIRQIICCIVSYDAHVCVLLFLGMIGYTLNWKWTGFFCFKVSLWRKCWLHNVVLFWYRYQCWTRNEKSGYLFLSGQMKWLYGLLTGLWQTNTGLSEDLIYWLQSGCKENLTKNTLPTLALRGINCKWESRCIQITARTIKKVPEQCDISILPGWILSSVVIALLLRLAKTVCQNTGVKKIKLKTKHSKHFLYGLWMR